MKCRPTCGTSGRWDHGSGYLVAVQGRPNSIRASAGVFYDWLSTNIYEQALRVDGFRQQELSILNPSYPNPGSVGSLSIGNRYQIDPALDLPRNVRFSGVSTSSSAPARGLSATYSYTKIDRSFQARI